MQARDMNLCVLAKKCGISYSTCLLYTSRCYKKAYPHEKAVQMILNGECGAFNPLLLQCLTDIQADLKEELQQHN